MPLMRGSLAPVDTLAAIVKDAEKADHSVVSFLLELLTQCSASVEAFVMFQRRAEQRPKGNVVLLAGKVK